MNITKEDRQKIREHLLWFAHNRQKISEHLLWLADSMLLLNDIEQMTTCNDCGIKMRCAYCPMAGDPVRYNCPLWVPDEPPKEET